MLKTNRFYNVDGSQMTPEEFLMIEPLTNHFIHDPTQSFENLFKE